MHNTFSYLVPAIFLLVITSGEAFAQSDSTSVYPRYRIADGNGDLLPESHEAFSSFTVYLNSNLDTVVTENAPGWQDDINNIQLGIGSSMAGVELQNFPHFKVGDTVYMRFVDMQIPAQGINHTPIDTIPYEQGPMIPRITLNQSDFPAPPDNVALKVDDEYNRMVSWEGNPNLSYDVYRRSRTDTIHTGEQRYMYTRIGEDISGGSFTDTNTDSSAHFAYIVYARDSEGNYSAHSEEVVKQFPITGITISDVKTRNVTISWDPITLDLGALAGYNIYRRTEEGSYGDTPIAYTRTDTHYTDTRLEPGQTYYYEVRPRNMDYKEVGGSEEIKVTTESSGNYTSYASLKTAIVIYRHSNDKDGGDYTIPQRQVEEIKEYLEIAKEFIWRNSKMRFNIEFDYLILDEYTRIDPSNTIVSTARHMRDHLGVANEQYDFIYRIAASNSGYWSATSTPHFIGILPGSDREVGFSKIHWTMPRWMRFGWDLHPENETASWQIQLFVHEGSHAFDGIYNTNGFPTFAHADHTYQYVYPYGNQYPDDYTSVFGSLTEFEAAMFRDFDHYKDLKPNWGDIYQAPDQDGDGFPDRDRRVAFDEERFGSSTSSADTDGDGLNDKQEAIDSILRFYQSDPTNPDTDGDGIQDGDDPYPRYAIDTQIKRRDPFAVDPFTPTIDGDISEWPARAQVADTAYFEFPQGSFAPKLYMTYDQDSLYLAADLQEVGEAVFRWDFEGDGFFVGRGNTEIKINMNTGTLKQLRSKDHSREYVDWQLDINDGNCHRHCGSWDGNSDYLDHFGRRVMPERLVHMETNTSSHNIEMAIAKRELAGLTLEHGSKIGFGAEFKQVGNEFKHYAALTDIGTQAYFTLGSILTDMPADEPIARSFKLYDNYPNPFNPATTIRYSLPKSTRVNLRVFNSLGREVTTLVNKRQSVGHHRVTFDGSNLSSGVYFYRLQTDSHQKTGKMLLVK